GPWRPRSSPRTRQASSGLSDRDLTCGLLRRRSLPRLRRSTLFLPRLVDDPADPVQLFGREPIPLNQGQEDEGCVRAAAQRARGVLEPPFEQVFPRECRAIDEGSVDGLAGAITLSLEPPQQGRHRRIRPSTPPLDEQLHDLTDRSGPVIPQSP